MKNKMVTAAEAVSAIKDGDMIAVGGFLGTGSPEILMDALVAQGTKHLTVIANDGGLNEENAPTNGKLKGIGQWRNSSKGRFVFELSEESKDEFAL